MRLTSALTTLAFALAACSAPSADGAESAATPSQSAASSLHPVSGLRIVPLTVTHAGRPIRFNVEVAGTDQEQAKGLMFRTALGADEGMIFPMNPPRQASFWMRNTVIPLDIIYIGTDGRISNMWESTVPYSEDSLPSTGTVKGVLELRGGRAKQLNLVPGDMVDW